MLLAFAAALVPAYAAAHVPDSNPIASQLYWANTGTDSIGRVSQFDPDDADPALIEGASDPLGLTFDGTYLYWTNAGSNRIGRGNIDGTGIDQSHLLTAAAPAGIAADDDNLYWSQSAAGAGSIGRAGLDGFGADQSLIATGASPCGVAVGPEAVVWANGGTMANPLGNLGRAMPSGGGAQQGFITTTSDPCGVAIAGNHLYWTNQSGASIGRANLDGTGANPAFLPMLTGEPCGVAVDGGHIYWTSDANTIGRARLDGTIDTQSFVTGLSAPCGITLAPTIEATPASQAFADTEVGKRSGARTIAVENTSSAALAIGAVSMAGSNPTSFEIVADGCTGILPPAGACEVGARFIPARAGARSAQLRISGNGGNLPYLVPLAGKALPDRTRPRLFSAAARPKSFRLPGRSARRSARAGTTIHYRLSESARVVFTIEHRRGGRPAGRLVQRAAEGRNSKPFSGRIRGRALEPGAYRVALVATDRAGNISRVRRIGFRVLG